METIDKSTWGDGPWLNEPDKLEYIDGGTNYLCAILRNPEIGNLCGYVGVPKDHPCYGKYYGDDAVNDISVHGGLTFSNVFVGEKDFLELWMFGFDCAHCHDFCPGLAETLRKLDGDHSWMEGDFYRDIEYVKKHIASLAKQLKEIADAQINP